MINNLKNAQKNTTPKKDNGTKNHYLFLKQGILDLDVQHG
jgi:hypothetical protein